MNLRIYTNSTLLTAYDGSSPPFSKKEKMTRKEILKLLSEQDIPFVVIGGVAMRIHNSPRVTHDIDLAVRTLDVDRIIDVLYPRSYFLVTEIQANSVHIKRDLGEAKTWIEKSKAGSASFLQTRNPPNDDAVPFDEIIVTSQIDFLFELGIPMSRLAKSALSIELGDFSFKTASAQDLLLLKQQRKEKDEADYDDIRFLEKLLKNTPPQPKEVSGDPEDQ